MMRLSLNCIVLLFLFCLLKLSEKSNSIPPSIHAIAIIKRLDLKLSNPYRPINPPNKITGRLEIIANSNKLFFLNIINNFLLKKIKAKNVPK